MLEEQRPGPRGPLLSLLSRPVPRRSLSEKPQVQPGKWRRVIRGLSDALAGLATYGLPRLEAEKLISPSETAKLAKETEFSDERGRILANCLARQAAETVTDFFGKIQNAFLLKAVVESATGGWSLGRRRMQGVPELPPHVTERAELLAEARKKVTEASESDEQCWVALVGAGGRREKHACIAAGPSPRSC